MRTAKRQGDLPYSCVLTSARADSSRGESPRLCLILTHSSEHGILRLAPPDSIMISTPVLETDRLRLRRYVLADEEALFEVFSDAQARAFYPTMADRGNVRAWIDWNLRNYDAFGFGLWVVELRTAGTFIGDCGLTYQNVEDTQQLEVGYHLVQRERRRGYATEAARACLDYGFEHTSCEEICSIVDPLNQASCAVAGRIHTDSRPARYKGRPVILFFTPRIAWNRSRSA
jgi:RimJ/RimL family protein N-acetyltransferase